jgi:mevalonate kinase
LRAIAEAPSKVIITGEHFVVHGAWALAAALPRRVHVEVSPAKSFKVRSDRFEKGSPAELLPVSRVVEAMSREFSVSPSVAVSIRSAIPEGAGLGSSAATMVAVAAAFSRLYSLRLGPAEVVRFAMEGERQVHGNPSGIDPTISAHGGVLLYRPGSAPKKVSLGSPRSLLVSYSGRKRSTRGQINTVARMKEKHPGLFSMLAKGVSSLSLDAAARLQEGDMRGLGNLLAVNHAVLGTVGVSNQVLDQMVDLFGSLGSYGAKLTGAGGGGSVLAVAPEAKEKSIVSGLTARGFETFRVQIPSEGVRSWPER